MVARANERARVRAAARIRESAMSKARARVALAKVVTTRLCLVTTTSGTATMPLGTTTALGVSGMLDLPATGKATIVVTLGSLLSVIAMTAGAKSQVGHNPGPLRPS